VASRSQLWSAQLLAPKVLEAVVASRASCSVMTEEARLVAAILLEMEEEAPTAAAVLGSWFVLLEEEAPNVADHARALLETAPSVADQILEESPTVAEHILEKMLEEAARHVLEEARCVAANFRLRLQMKPWADGDVWLPVMKPWAEPTQIAIAALSLPSLQTHKYHSATVAQCLQAGCLLKQGS
jgi:hypothetical protein